jgi:hypothetical protein
VAWEAKTGYLRSGGLPGGSILDALAERIRPGQHFCAVLAQIVEAATRGNNGLRGSDYRFGHTEASGKKYGTGK